MMVEVFRVHLQMKFGTLVTLKWEVSIMALQKWYFFYKAQAQRTLLFTVGTFLHCVNASSTSLVLKFGTRFIFVKILMINFLYNIIIAISIWKTTGTQKMQQNFNFMAQTLALTHPVWQFSFGDVPLVSTCKHCIFRVWRTYKWAYTAMTWHN